MRVTCISSVAYFFFFFDILESTFFHDLSCYSLSAIHLCVCETERTRETETQRMRPNYPHVFHLYPIISAPPPGYLQCQTGLWSCVQWLWFWFLLCGWVSTVDLDLFGWTNDAVNTIKLSNMIELVGVSLASGVQLTLVLELCFLQNFWKSKGEISGLIGVALRWKFLSSFTD